MPNAERIRADQCQSYAARCELIERVANQLEEKAAVSSRVWWQLMMVATHYGHEVLERLVSEAIEIDSKGGMMILNGRRRRTLGGIYFQLLRRELGLEAWYELRVEIALCTGAPVPMRPETFDVLEAAPSLTQSALPSPLQQKTKPVKKREKDPAKLVVVPQAQMPQKEVLRAASADSAAGAVPDIRTQQKQRRAWRPAVPEVVYYRRALG